MKETQDTSIFCETYKIPWWKNVYYFFYRTVHRVFDVKRDLKCFFVRGKKGYSYMDAWSFDSYLCRVIPGGIQQLIDNLHGAPNDLFDEKADDPTWKWQEILEKIRDGFIAGKALIDMDYWNNLDMEATELRQKELYAEFEDGMGLFKEYFFHLWD